MLFLPISNNVMIAEMFLPNPCSTHFSLKNINKDVLWTSKLATKLNLAIFKEQVALLGFTYVNVFEDILIFEMYFIMPSLSLIRDSLHLVGFNFSSSCEQQPIWTDLRIGWAGLRRRLNYIWWRYNITAFIAVLLSFFK